MPSTRLLHHDSAKHQTVRWLWTRAYSTPLPSYVPLKFVNTRVRPALGDVRIGKQMTSEFTPKAPGPPPASTVVSTSDPHCVEHAHTGGHLVSQEPVRLTITRIVLTDMNQPGEVLLDLQETTRTALDRAIAWAEVQGYGGLDDALMRSLGDEPPSAGFVGVINKPHSLLVLATWP